MLGKRIKIIREALGYSQIKFSRILGFKSKIAVSLWERGEREPNIETLIRIAKLGGVSLDYLILGKETDKENQSNIMIGLRERIKEMGKEMADQKDFINMVAEKAPKYLSNNKGRKK